MQALDSAPPSRKKTNDIIHEGGADGHPIDDAADRPADAADTDSAGEAQPSAGQSAVDAGQSAVDTPMWSVLMTYLLVGHTHDKIDRFFSRVKAAVAGRDYYTMYE